MEKKRLLMTASTFPRWENDTEPRFILDLAKSLLPYYDVTVLAPAAVGAKSRETLEGVKVIRYHYLPVKKWETLCYPGAIVPRIKEKKSRAIQVPFLFLAMWGSLIRLKKHYDLIHVHWLIPQGIIQGLVGGTYLVTGHGTDVMSMNSGIVKALKKRCLERASGVTAVSQKLKRSIIENYGLPEERISVISMGCDTSNFSPDFRNETLFLQNGRKNILFVGRLAEVKGVTYLIEAMKQVDANLYIVGSGPLEADLKKQAEGQADKITFLGAKNHQALAELYASADLLATPSVKTKDGDEEGLGLVILEAMASGTPVVASRSGGIPGVIRHGENGMLAEPGDSADLARQINAVLGDEALYQRLCTAGFETAQSYDYAAVAVRYRDLMEQIM